LQLAHLTVDPDNLSEAAALVEKRVNLERGAQLGRPVHGGTLRADPIRWRASQDQLSCAAIRRLSQPSIASKL